MRKKKPSTETRLRQEAIYRAIHGLPPPEEEKPRWGLFAVIGGIIVGVAAHLGIKGAAPTKGRAERSKPAAAAPAEKKDYVALMNEDLGNAKDFVTKFPNQRNTRKIKALLEKAEKYVIESEILVKRKDFKGAIRKLDRMDGKALRHIRERLKKVNTAGMSDAEKAELEKYQGAVRFAIYRITKSAKERKAQLGK
jgi:hypothetical protein